MAAQRIAKYKGALGNHAVFACASLNPLLPTYGFNASGTVTPRHTQGDYRGTIKSCPPMYGRNISGTVTVLSLFW